MAASPSLLKLYLVLSDESEASEALISRLGEMFGVVSQVNPRLLVIPLLPWAGWRSVRSIAALDVSAISNGYETISLEASCILSPADEEERRVKIIEGKLSLPPEMETGTSRPLLFKNVAMGGTFDRLHSGHMLLLATAALVTSKSLYIGITSEALLTNKAHSKLLQSYEERERSAVSYAHCICPQLKVVTGMLKDPKEPTEAELRPEMQAIVVSLETLPGAMTINEGRRARGYDELKIITVPLVGGSQADSKLSSSGLRAIEDVEDRL